MAAEMLPASQPRGSHRPAAKVAARNVVIDSVILERAARVIRVLGHPLRLRLLETLEAGERNVTDLVPTTGASQALVSQHLAILRAEGVVGFRRDGGRIYYRITEPKVHRILECIRDCDLPEMSLEAASALIDPTDDS
jgi:DNA-binding transcriptional ArsR family regulator